MKGLQQQVGLLLWTVLCMFLRNAWAFTGVSWASKSTSAAAAGEGRCVARLSRLSMSSPPSKPDSSPEPPKKHLFKCIKEGDVETVRQWMAVGMPGNIADVFGEPALNFAASKGRLDCMRVLVDGGATANVKSNEGGGSALHKACRKGHMDVIKYLVEECRANVDAMDNRGDTPLMLACYWGQLPAVEYLVNEADADLYIYNNEGKRAGEDFETIVDQGEEKNAVFRKIASIVQAGRGGPDPSRPAAFLDA